MSEVRKREFLSALRGNSFFLFLRVLILFLFLAHYITSRTRCQYSAHFLCKISLSRFVPPSCKSPASVSSPMEGVRLSPSGSRARETFLRRGNKSLPRLFLSGRCATRGAGSPASWRADSHALCSPSKTPAFSVPDIGKAPAVPRLCQGARCGPSGSILTAGRSAGLAGDLRIPERARGAALIARGSPRAL